MDYRSRGMYPNRRGERPDNTLAGQLAESPEGSYAASQSWDRYIMAYLPSEMELISSDSSVVEELRHSHRNETQAPCPVAAEGAPWAALVANIKEDLYRDVRYVEAILERRKRRDSASTLKKVVLCLTVIALTSGTVLVLKSSCDA